VRHLRSRWTPDIGNLDIAASQGLLRRIPDDFRPSRAELTPAEVEIDTRAFGNASIGLDGPDVANRGGTMPK